MTRLQPSTVELSGVGTVNVLGLVGYGDVPVTDPYVDRFWLPVLGPTVTALLRFAALEDGQSWPVHDMARAVGLGGSARHLSEAMARAERYEVARWLQADSSFNAKIMLPPLPGHHLRKVPGPYVAKYLRGES